MVRVNFLSRLNKFLMCASKFSAFEARKSTKPANVVSTAKRAGVRHNNPGHAGAVKKVIFW